MTPKDILQLESSDMRQAYLFEEKRTLVMLTSIQPTGSRNL